MVIENISEGLGAHPAYKGYMDAKRKEKSPDEIRDQSSLDMQKDQVEISKEAHELVRKESLVHNGKKILNKIEETNVREEKINKAEARIQLDYYERKEVLDKIVDYLIRMGYSSKFDYGFASEKRSFVQKLVERSETDEGVETTGNNMDNKDEIRWDKVREAEERIDQNFYDQSRVLDSIAKLLLG